MLKYLSLIICLSALLPSAHAAGTCTFVENSTVCANEKIKILDDSLSDVHLSKTRKKELKSTITKLCANDVGCVHNTLAYQYTQRGETIIKYPVVVKNTFNKCMSVQVAYPEHGKVLLLDEDGSEYEASFNENLYTTVDRQLYVLDSKHQMLKTNCKGVSTKGQLIKMN